MEINSININQKHEDEATRQNTLRELVEALMHAAKDKKANDIIAVRVAEKTILADWFMFMNGTSQIHVKALCQEVEDKAAELGLILKRREGYNEGRWIVLDFSSIIVHIFHPEEREYYNVERLWMDPSTDTIRID